MLESTKRITLQATPFLPPVVRDRLVPRRNQWTTQDDAAVARGNPDGKTLLIGPLNTAGQAKRWADAAALLPGVDARSLVATRNAQASGFPVDVTTSLNALRHSPTWSKRQSQELLHNFTHVLFESASPMMGRDHGRDIEREVDVLREAGVKVGIIWYGSDIRRPSLHRQFYSDSPFYSEIDGLTERLEANTAANAALAERLGVPEFNTGPDLLAYRPNATWIPTLHDAKLWDPANLGIRSTEKRQAGSLPVVAHIPSRAPLKGTDKIRRAMESLKGVVDYREFSGLPPAEVARRVSEADIVIDQVSMGVFGVASLEAMSLGIPAISQVGQYMRDGMSQITGLDSPIVEATPSTLADVVKQLAKDEELRHAIGQAGQRYVAAVHSPENVAQVLAESFLD